MSKRNTYEYVKNIIEVETNIGWKLVSKIYIKNNLNLEMLCDKGHPVNISFSNFVSGCRCKQCYLDSLKEIKRLKPKVINLDTRTSRNIYGYNDWVYSVFERDNYTCQNCGEKKYGNLNAHHLDGYNWCIPRRIDVTNGVALCSECHKEFHHDYGYGDNTEEQFISWSIDNEKSIFNIDEIKKESVFKNRPPKKPTIDSKDYFRNYYVKNSQTYSENDLDNIFYEIMSEYTNAENFTTTKFKEISGVNPMSLTGVFKMSWIDVLDRYNKKDEVFKYICDEYLDNYYKEYNCSIELFFNLHKYISQDLIKQYTIEQIKSSCGFKGSHQQHNFEGLKRNFYEVKNKLNKIPFFKEFMELTSISLSSYYNCFNTNSYDEFILNFINSKDDLKEYENNKKDRIIQIASKGGRNSGYTDEEKETEFRRVFDNYFKDNGKYPTRREFNELSKYSEKAYMKKWKLSWNQVKIKYGYEYQVQ